MVKKQSVVLFSLIPLVFFFFSLKLLKPSVMGCKNVHTPDAFGRKYLAKTLPKVHLYFVFLLVCDNICDKMVNSDMKMIENDREFENYCILTVVLYRNCIDSLLVIVEFLMGELN